MLEAFSLLTLHVSLMFKQVGQFIDFFPEIQQCFGSDATAGGIQFQFSTRIRADVRLVKDARAKGIDCKDIKLSWANESSKGGKGRKFCFKILLNASLLCITQIQILMSLHRDFKHHGQRYHPQWHQVPVHGSLSAYCQAPVGPEGSWPGSKGRQP